MKKTLNAKHTLIRRLSFPRLFPLSQTNRGGYTVLLGIGGNIGDVLRRFEHLLIYLQRDGIVHILETAPILKNPPFGYTQQADFYNSLLLVETQLTAKALLRYILRVERVFGRKRSFADAPRTLDIDMIFYENIILNTKRLTLPHHAWMKRDSVLIPLSYMKGQG